jgi:mono/diheme cytochrome c family protein
MRNGSGGQKHGKEPIMKTRLKITMVPGTLIVLALLVVLGLAAAGGVWALNVRGGVDVSGPVTPLVSTPELVARGAYLARAGNCMTCHTARGGQPYAGGRAIDTPFGAVYTSNLTPDAATGLGSWGAAHFYRALHNGRSKDGHLLNPVFPYTSYTLVTRDDSDAMFAYLQSLPAVAQTNPPTGLRFPYNLQASLAVWRALYFTPGNAAAEPALVSVSAELQRGAYLVNGLGHCSACHTPRDALGGEDSALNLAGGLIPVQNWYAPSLISVHEAGVADWPHSDVVRLLKTGVSPRASVAGPMAEVVQGGLQHLTDQDLGAMAAYLQALPPAAARPEVSFRPPPAAVAERGAKLYEQHCAQCHGADGQGQKLGNSAGLLLAGTAAYPALAGNRAVLMPNTANLVQIVLNGGYAPATQGNPRPFGMPPFVLLLDDNDVASVLTHIRSAWGNQGAVVSPLEVNRIRSRNGAG